MGPRAGQTQVYPHSFPVGMSCWDGVSSAGVSVADKTSGPQPANPAPQPAPPPAQKSTVIAELKQPAQQPVHYQDTRRKETPESEPPTTPEPPGPSRKSAPVDFTHALFKSPLWMNAFYNEDFALLNKDRIPVLSYIAGFLALEANEPDDRGCPKEPLSASVIQPQSVYSVSAAALFNGREYKAGAGGQLQVGLDQLFGLLGNGDPSQGWGYIGATTAREAFAEEGTKDARYLLDNYEGCSGATFKRVYSGIGRFTFNDPPAFRNANGTLALELKILGPALDRFYTEQKGKPYFTFGVSVVNGDQLPKDMFPFQSWASPADRDEWQGHSGITSPVQAELFARDGKTLARWED
ncbi:MAG: hypothetical protein ACRD3Q_16695, partial [Terriglobales bacterium]